MGLEFLARVRRASIWLGAVASLVTASYRGPVQGLALFLGVSWALVNLVLLESLVVAATGADRNAAPAVRRAARSVIGMLALFAVGAVLLLKLPAIWLVAGFSIPLAVIASKGAAMLLLPTGFWRRLTASTWRGAALIAVIVLGGWLASTAWTSNAPATSAARAGAPAARARVIGPLAALDQSTAAGGHDNAAAGEGARPVTGGHGGEEAGPQKFPNVITVLARAFPHAPWALFLHHFEAIIFSLSIALLLCVVAALASRNPQMIPGPLQNVVEWMVETLYDFVVGILGPDRGRRYLPFLGSLFVYILAMNLFGLLPFMDSPTSNLNVTVALALVVFVYSQLIGFRELGAVGYFDHLMGNPRTVIGWLLVPLMLPIHVMGELAKPISLSCRLFGNIFGEDMLLVAFASLGVTVLSFTRLPIGVPLQLPFMFLALLTSTLQALVFTVLSTIYILLMLPHDDHAHEEHAQPAH